MLGMTWGLLNKGEVEMLLVVDIGNTNIVLGIYREKELLATGGFRPIDSERRMNMAC